MKPVVAIVSKQRLIGATNGSSAYVLSIARSLVDAGCSVHLIQPSPDIFGRTPYLKLQDEMSVFDRHVIRGAVAIGRWRVVMSPTIWIAALAGMLRGLARKAGVKGKWVKDRPRPYSVATPWKRRDFAFVAENLPENTVALVADYMFCSPAFGVVGENCERKSRTSISATAIIMHDLFHARGGADQDSVALVERHRELELLAAAQTVFAIQESEFNFVQESLPDVRALLVPMPAQPVAEAEPGEEDRILFVGSHTAPNHVGLDWFFAKVWPIVLKHRPDCRLEVAGTVNRAFDHATRDRPIPENVRFLGMVPDLDENYRRAGVVISPLTFGSGLKIKLIEALAKGKAIVATPITLQGVEHECRSAVACTDDPVQFAQHVVELCASREKRAKLARNALECAERQFSADSAHRALRHWAEGAARQGGAPAETSAPLRNGQS